MLAVGGFVAVRALGLLVLFVVAHQQGRSGYRLLTSWDAQWYARIAEDGYGFSLRHPDGRLLADYAFFPLLPFLERCLAALTGLSAEATGLVISTASSVAAAAGIFAVARLVIGSRAAVVATVLWAALPVGLALSMAYTEALFTALAAWSLYAVLSGRWLTAALLAFAAGLTRPSGVAVVAAVVVAAIAPAASRRDRGSPGAGPIRPLVAALVAPVGLLGYLGWAGWSLGSVTGYLEVANGWGNGIDGGVAFAGWIRDLLDGDTVMLGVLVVLGVGVLVALFYLGIRQGQPLPLVIFTATIIMLALSTSGYFGSKPRYLLPAFPLVFPLAQWLARRGTAVCVAVLALLSAAAAVYGSIWLAGPGPP